MQDKEYDIGIIIGRFHTPELHSSHKKLFDYVLSKHEKVICFLGLGHLKSTKRNPLDFHQRKIMIGETYPNIQCFYIKDCKKNKTWATQVDNMISDQLMPGQKPLLYGSRDSFINAYYDGKGRYDTEELESDSFISATEIRKNVTRSIQASKEVRIGMIMGASNRYPISYTTVDVAIMDKNRTKILLARKQDEEEFRFVGGFSDPQSISLEQDAKREVLEETHLDISEPQYICSTLIDDWRYRSEEDKIKTTFWIADRIGGEPEADDDIAEVKWFNINDFIYPAGTSPYDQPYKLDNLVHEHQILMTKLLKYLNK